MSGGRSPTTGRVTIDQSASQHLGRTAFHNWMKVVTAMRTARTSRWCLDSAIEGFFMNAFRLLWRRPGGYDRLPPGPLGWGSETTCFVRARARAPVVSDRVDRGRAVSEVRAAWPAHAASPAAEGHTVATFEVGRVWCLRWPDGTAAVSWVRGALECFWGRRHPGIWPNDTDTSTGHSRIRPHGSSSPLAPHRVIRQAGDQRDKRFADVPVCRQIRIGRMDVVLLIMRPAAQEGSGFDGGGFHRPGDVENRLGHTSDNSALIDLDNKGARAFTTTHRQRRGPAGEHCPRIGEASARSRRRRELVEGESVLLGVHPFDRAGHSG